MYQLKKIVFVFIITTMVLAACAQATETVAPVEELPTAVPVPTEPALPKLACAPNCQYSDLVVGFLQTGSEGGWRAAQRPPERPPGVHHGQWRKRGDGLSFRL